MKAVDIAVADLKEYGNNPRLNDGAVSAVAESIKEFGFKVPIVVDNEYVIVAGHTRLRAAKQLGLETVPCIIADDLTAEQVKAFRLADNKTAELASWDVKKLEEEHEKIGDIDLTLFGFDEQDDVDINEFYEEAAQKEKEPKKIYCPNCGEWFTLEEVEEE